MNPALIWVLSAGAVAGFGVALLVRALAPVQPELHDALVRLDERTPPPSPGVSAGEGATPARRLLARVGARLGRLRITTPDEDLALVGLTREQFLALRVGAPLAGLVVGPVMAAVTALAGVPLPAVFTVAESLALGGLLYVYVGRTVAQRARAARLEMRYALVSYINVVALWRAAGSGIVEALESAAAVTDSWTYRRIARQLDHAARAGQQPWEGLAELARSLDIRELADVGSIAGVSGREGAAVFDTLLARARSLRGQLLTDERSEANELSTRMTYPQTLLALATVAFLLYPALERLLSS